MTIELPMTFATIQPELLKLRRRIARSMVQHYQAILADPDTPDGLKRDALAMIATCRGEAQEGGDV